MCLFCTKDLVICRKFISQSFVTKKKKSNFLCQGKENINNFVVNTNMKITKQRKQNINKGEVGGGGGEISSFQPFTDLQQIRFLTNLQIPPQDTSVFVCHISRDTF